MEFVEDMIKMCRKIQFGWSRQKDFVKHTGVVVILDGNPAFTIDYGADGNNMPGNSSLDSITKLVSEVPSAIGMFLWSRQNSQLEDTLFTTTNRSLAIQIVKELYQMIIMGDYQMVVNNCRHYVNKAVEILLKKAENDTSLEVDLNALKRFHEKMKQVQGIDAGKIAGFGATAVGIVGVVTSFAVQISKVVMK